MEIIRMYIVDIWTIDSAVPAGSITYRSVNRIEVGSWTHCAVGRRTIWGIIGSCTPAHQAKLKIKSATFQTKELDPSILLQGIPEKVISDLAMRYSPILPTDIVHALFSPLWAVNGIYKQNKKPASFTTHQGSLEPLYTDPHLKQKNVLWICPHELSARSLCLQLEQSGIRVILIIRPPSKKTLQNIHINQPRHLICTASMALPWIPGVDTCVVTEFTNIYYAQKIRDEMYINRSELLMNIWKHWTYAVIVHDWVLPFGYIAHTKNKLLNYAIPNGLIEYRVKTKNKKMATVTDITETVLDAASRIFQRESTARILIIAKSKYEASGVACFYCGWRGVCPTCNTRLVVSRNSNDTPTFKCTTCEYMTIAYDRCPTCHGPSLSNVSVGTKQLLRTLLDQFSDVSLHDMVRDESNTERLITKMKRIVRLNGPAIVCTTAITVHTIPAGYFSHCIILPYSWWFGSESDGTEIALRLLMRLATHTQKVYISPETMSTTFLSATIPETLEQSVQTDIAARQRFDPGSLVDPFVSV